MFCSFLSRLLLFFCLLAGSAAIQADSLNLPRLGDSTSGTISLQQEYRLGQYWLRAFRQQARLAEDPLLYTYLHHLIQRLAFYSPLEEKYFDLVVVDNKSFNAFAVPGNVIGINTGLFLHAETEDQLASVVAHELAHLSQRHYARSLERQKRQNVASLAGMLGSLLIIAAGGGGEAGIAAISATQAAAISNQLKYSRVHEQEADRIGIRTLAAAGMNPMAAADMFQHMLVATRYRSDLRDFEFLLTHPLAEGRVADAINIAQQYPKQLDQDSFIFHLMKARIFLHHSSRASQAAEHFRQQEERAKYPNAARYGLALSLLKMQQSDEAEAIIDALYRESPQQTAFQIAKIDLLTQQGKAEQAISMARQHLSLSPGNYALSMHASQLFVHNNHKDEAVSTMRRLIDRKWPDTPDVWYQLAEIEGLAGNIAEVHLARAEYFIRIGAFDAAIRHLNLARPLLSENQRAISRIELRLNEVEQLKRNNPF